MYYTPRAIRDFALLIGLTLALAACCSAKDIYNAKGGCLLILAREQVDERPLPTEWHPAMATIVDVCLR